MSVVCGCRIKVTMSFMRQQKNNGNLNLENEAYRFSCNRPSLVRFGPVWQLLPLICNIWCGYTLHTVRHTVTSITSCFLTYQWRLSDMLSYLLFLFILILILVFVIIALHMSCILLSALLFMFIALKNTHALSWHKFKLLISCAMVTERLCSC